MCLSACHGNWELTFWEVKGSGSCVRAQSRPFRGMEDDAFTEA